MFCEKTIRLIIEIALTRPLSSTVDRPQHATPGSIHFGSLEAKINLPDLCACCFDSSVGCSVNGTQALVGFTVHTLRSATRPMNSAPCVPECDQLFQIQTSDRISEVIRSGDAPDPRGGQQSPWA